MIFEVGSSLATFKTVRFKEGLNVLVADRHERSDETRTRNGSGKSSLVLIVHFLMGSSPDKNSLFRAKELSRASFWGRMRFGGNDVFVERFCSDDGKVYVDIEGPLPPGMYLETDVANGRRYVSVDDWRRWLGASVFRLPFDPKGTPFSEKHSPTFRSMFGYFARKREDMGFHEPWKFSKDQQKGDAQVALSYMLGLVWVLARDFETERQNAKNDQVARRRNTAANKIDDKLDTVAKLRAAHTIWKSSVSITPWWTALRSASAARAS